MAEQDYEEGKLMKAVTAVKNEVKDKERVRDVVMSDHFITLREPLIEQQKKTDEKQNKIIEQLRKKQLGLTEGIQGIMTLNQELPQITYEKPQITDEERKKFIANIENNFDEEGRKIIEYSGLDPPSALLQKMLMSLKNIKNLWGNELIKWDTRLVV